MFVCWVWEDFYFLVDFRLLGVYVLLIIRVWKGFSFLVGDWMSEGGGKCCKDLGMVIWVDEVLIFIVCVSYRIIVV